jgi:hypothetical protein
MSLSASKTSRNGQLLGSFSDANAFNGRMSTLRYNVLSVCCGSFVERRFLAVDLLIVYHLCEFWGCMSKKSLRAP